MPVPGETGKAKREANTTLLSFSLYQSRWQAGNSKAGGVEGVLRVVLEG